MRKSEITAVFQASPEKVWRMVTDNRHTAWRSDLASVDCSADGKTFVEHTKDGFQTTFHITQTTPIEKYAFSMENSRFTGKWTGLFSETGEGGCRIVFTEEIQMKNQLLEWISHLFLNLKKMQETYVSDLKKALGETENTGN